MTKFKRILNWVSLLSEVDKGGKGLLEVIRFKLIDISQDNKLDNFTRDKLMSSISKLGYAIDHFNDFDTETKSNIASVTEFIRKSILTFK